MQQAYNLLMVVATPLLVAWLWWRGRKEPGYRLHMQERFGTIAIQKTGGIWIHAASMGEIAAAAPVIQSIHLTAPDFPLLITVLTPTGRARAKALFPDAEVFYMPFDQRNAMETFMAYAQPKLCIIMETEIWPNMLAALYRHGVPVAIVNARLSDAKFARYQQFKNLFTPWIANLPVVCTQTNEHAGRWRILGARAPVVTGNTKFDVTVSESQRNIGKQLRSKLGNSRPVWIAASIHPGELQSILFAFRDLRLRYGNLLLILVPRHPERFGEAVRACRNEHWVVALRSKNEGDILTDIYIGDTVGDLIALYAAADVAFVGGSLVNKGGHNPLEAAAVGVPIICGPHMANFRDVTNGLSDAGAVHTARNVRDLEAVVTRILDSQVLRADLGRRAQAWVTLHGGAVAKTMDALLPLLKNLQPKKPAAESAKKD